MTTTEKVMIGCTIALIATIGAAASSINSTIRRYAPDLEPVLGDISRTLTEIERRQQS